VRALSTALMWFTGPDKDPAALIYREAARFDEFGFQIVEVVVVQRELTLQGAVRGWYDGAWENRNCALPDMSWRGRRLKA